MTEPAGPVHRRRLRRRGAVVDEVLTVGGVRVVRRTVLHLDAATGQPLDVHQHDTPIPAVLGVEDDGSPSPRVTP